MRKSDLAKKSGFVFLAHSKKDWTVKNKSERNNYMTVCINELEVLTQG